MIFEQHDAQAFAPVRSLTVGGFRDRLLEPAKTGAHLSQIAWGLTPEMVAAVSNIIRA